MKKILIVLALLIILNPLVVSAAVSQESQQITLLKQLIVLLEARLEQLLQMKGIATAQVLGVSTSTTPISGATKVVVKKKRGGGGGGGGSSVSTPVSSSLVISMAGAYNLFNVTANQTLSPEFITITPLVFPNNIAISTSLNLKAALNDGTFLDVELVKEGSQFVYKADLRARLTVGQQYTGSFEVFYPESMSHENIIYTVLYEGNGITRTLNLENVGEVEAVLQSSSLNPASRILAVSIENISGTESVFAFDLENTGGANARVDEVQITFNGTPDIPATSVINEVFLTIDDQIFPGTINQDNITFSNLLQTIPRYGSETFELSVNFRLLSDEYELPQSVSFSLNSNDLIVRKIIGESDVVVSGSGIVGNNFTLELPGERDELVVKTSPSDPDSSMFQVKDDSESDYFTVFAFDLDTEDSISNITVNEIVTNVTFEGVSFADVFADAELVIDGVKIENYIIQSVTPESSNIVFLSEGNVVIGAGERVSAELNLKSKALTVENVTVFASIDSDLISAEGVDDLNPNAPNQLQGTAVGNVHTLRTKGIDVNVESVNAVVTNVDGNVNDYAVYTIDMEVTAFEQDVYIAIHPTTSISHVLENPSGAIITVGSRSVALTSTADEQNDYYVINEGETENFTLWVTYSPEVTVTAARLQLESIKFANSEMIPNQTWVAIPEEDYRTSIVTIVN